MNARSLISNFSVAFLAQGVSVGLSVVSALLVPRVLSVEAYGYWQLFLYYVSFVGFFHLGLNDGVYLLNGGRTRAEVDKRSVISQFWFGMSYQGALVALALVVVPSLGLGPERTFVLLWSAVFILLQNAAFYLGYVFQAMNETKLFSYSAIIERLVFLVPLVWLLWRKETSYEAYVVAYFGSCACQLAYCAWYARDFFAAGLEPARRAASEGIASIRVGAKLMLANIASTLILGVARFAIDAVWGIETFAELSFSISLVYFFLNFFMQASMVLFPALRQSDENEVATFFRTARDALDVVLPCVYLLYFPAVWALSLWLPRYEASLALFALLLPVCVYDGKMSIVSTTFFKVMRQERRLLVVNVATMLFSALASFVGAYLLRRVEFVIGMAVVAVVARALVSEWLIARDLHEDRGSVWVGSLVVTIAFIALSAFTPRPVAFVACAAIYGVFLLVNRATIRSLASAVRRSLAPAEGEGEAT